MTNDMGVWLLLRVRVDDGSTVRASPSSRAGLQHRGIAPAHQAVQLSAAVIDSLGDRERISAVRPPNISRFG
jgi:hypothetical protein